MAKDLNQCAFIGRLGKEPKIVTTNNGSIVANFSIACSDDYNDKNTGQKVDQTNWINIVAFGKLAEIIGKYLKKGSKIYVSGKQVTRKWQDQSGADKYTTEIVANEMQMLDSKPDDQQGQQQSQAPQQQGSGSPPMQHPQTGSGQFDDFNDIPF